MATWGVKQPTTAKMDINPTQYPKKPATLKENGSQKYPG